MNKQNLVKHIMISSILTIIVITIILGFSMAMFNRYSMPNEDNTSIISGKVTDVWHGVPSGKVVVEISNGDSLQLVYPFRIRTLYSHIGYDCDELADLLIGKNVKCLRMNQLPWALEIYADDIVIDNNKLTEDQIIVSRIGIIFLSLIMIAITLVGEVEYLKPKYKRYKKAEKARIKKLKTRMKNVENI